MGNPFVHIELMSTDVGKAKAFYGKLFDWKLEDMPIPEMTYTMIKVGEGTGGRDPRPVANQKSLNEARQRQISAAIVPPAWSGTRSGIALPVRGRLMERSLGCSRIRLRCRKPADAR